jgi:hypothetical protein
VIRRSVIHAALVLGMLMGLLIVASPAPAAAYVTVQDCTGTCADWEAYDDELGRKGANCLYELASFDLDKISVRPPQMHGNYHIKTKVEWRFKIQRQPVSGATPFHKFYTSQWWSAKADDMIPAYEGHGYKRESWTAPENPNGRFRVAVEMRWWHHGSVEGKVRILYEWYKAKHGSDTSVSMGYCLEEY